MARTAGDIVALGFVATAIGFLSYEAYQRPWPFVVLGGILWGVFSIMWFAGE